MPSGFNTVVAHEYREKHATLVAKQELQDHVAASGVAPALVWLLPNAIGGCSLAVKDVDDRGSSGAGVAGESPDRESPVWFRMLRRDLWTAVNSLSGSCQPS